MKKTTTSSIFTKSQYDKLHFVLAGACLFFAGSFFGGMAIDLFGGEGEGTEKKVVRIGGETFIAIEDLSGDFKAALDDGEEFAVFDDKTWIPVPGNPVEVVVLNDSTCGAKCNVKGPVDGLRQMITPALLVRHVDVSEDEAADLISDFDVTSVPQFFLGAGIEKIKDEESGKTFLDASAVILTEHEGLYRLHGEKIGFKVGKFLSAPQFADLGSEPVQGDGKVRVVEFTDYQCPDCKRLHDQNKALIKQLISDDKIEYVLKDFPLGFHAQANSAHSAANCALELGGQDQYWSMHDKVFDTQKVWSGKPDADDHFASLASDLGIDVGRFETCMKDPETLAEIKADQAEGSTFGVSGTPALFIGSQVMPGAIGPEAFENAVNAELAK